MLALDGARVQLERAEAGAIEPLSELLPRLVAAGVREVSANGVLGDPAGASAQEGRDMVRAAVGRLTDLLDSWAMPA
jgi:creatinine amidohydrolase